MGGSNLHGQKLHYVHCGEAGELCLNAQSRLEKEARLPKLFTTGFFRTKFDMLLLFKL